MSYYYNDDVYPSRDVHCPHCSHIQYSGKETVQCSGCRKRFKGDNYLYKTPEDRNKERYEQNIELKILLKDLDTFYSKTKAKIEKICEEYKPIYPLEPKKDAANESTTSVLTQ